MLSNLAIAALAAAGAVNAGPLQRRQTEVASSAISSVESAVSSGVSSAVESVSSGATSAASGASSTAAEATSGASSAASSAAATSTGGSTGGNETFPAYPCPAGFLLTYAAVNQTLPLPVTQVTQAAGEWASSPLFPNVTDAMGGNEPGATHTINVGEIALPEVLVSVDANQTSGSAIWTWNGSLPQPVTAMGVSLSNYSTVIQIYDPDYTTTGSIGNSTFVNLFTNACATPQAAAMELLMTLGGLELGNLVAAVGGNSTSGGGAMSSMAMGSSMAMSSGMDMSSSMASGAEGATSSAASGAASATSAAGSAVESVTSAPASAASAATGAAGSAVSSADAAATSAA